MQRLGHKLSEDGFLKLVEPRLISINKRWEQLDLKLDEVYNVSVSMGVKTSEKSINLMDKFFLQWLLY